MEQKIQKNVSVFEIIALEVGVQILTILNGILGIGSQYVNKHHYDIT